MPIPWNEDKADDLPIIESNLRALLLRIIREAPLRLSPSVEMAQGWHRAIYDGVELPIQYYAGEVRDSDPEFPELYGYEVSVGSVRGAESRRVPEELERFAQAMKRAVGILDPIVMPGADPADQDELWSVLTLCASAHGEWVRIHPFANGNGRTARLWANWCALRYGLPPFVRLKPRPDGERYAVAARLSMAGDHGPMAEVFAAVLDRYLRQP